MLLKSVKCGKVGLQPGGENVGGYFTLLVGLFGEIV